MTTTIKKTVAESGGDFTSVADAVSWFKTNYPDFVTSDIIGEIEITGSWTNADSSLVSTVITTDATRYLYIHTTGAARHSGVWSTTAHRLVKNSTNIYFTTMHVHLDGLQVQQTGNGRCIFLTGSGTAHVSNMLLLGGANGDNVLEVRGGYTAFIWNVIGYGGAYAGLNTGDSGTQVTCYNSVFCKAGARGVYAAGGTVIVKNVYAGGNPTADFTGTMTKTACASSDLTGSEGFREIAVDTDTFKNVTSGSEDFHLASSSSLLYHRGTDTSGDDAPMNFTTDIDGDDYYDTDSKRSIGADEIPPSSGGWVEYYTPYTYPHPLRTALGDTTLPPPPPPPPVVVEESNYFDLSDSIGASIIIHAKGENESANGTITFIFSFYKPYINGVWHYVDSDPYVISLNGINDVCATFVIPYDVRKIQLKSIEYEDDETNSALVNVTLNKLCFDNFEQADSLVSSLKAVINEQKRPKV